MGEKLAAPPFYEALCEISFAPSTPWDWTLPGRLYERLKADFPTVRQMNQVELRVEGSPTATQSQLLKRPDRVQLIRQDHSQMIQISPQMLVVNHLQPYSSWRDFLDLILSTFKEYTKILQVSVPSQLGLRYINRLEVTEQDSDLRRFLTTLPPMVGPLKKPITGFVQRYEVVGEGETDRLLHQTGLMREEEEMYIMLDLYYLSREGEAFATLDDLSSWLERAHQAIYEAFIDSLQPDILASFRGEKS